MYIDNMYNVYVYTLKKAPPAISSAYLKEILRPGKTRGNSLFLQFESFLGIQNICFLPEKLSQFLPDGYSSQSK